MTDRYSGFVVILDHDLRDDDAQATITALQQIRGVVKVEPQLSSFSDHVAEARVRQEIHKKLWDVIYGKKANGAE